MTTSILDPQYKLNPKGKSSQRFLRLMNEPFKTEEISSLFERGKQLEARSNCFPWQQDLLSWPPKNPRCFGHVSFFRMFSSSTYRSLQHTDQTLTKQETEFERLTWIKAHLLVQNFVKNGIEPNFNLIQQINSIFGHKMRSQALHSRFSCFDVQDLPEAVEYFDHWYQDLCNKNVWPIQKATLAASYLLAVHPFENGNGRTVRLVLDWILNLHQLPPACFLNRYQALLVRSPGQWDTPHPLALERVLNAIENTLKLCMGQNILEGDQRA